MGRSGNPGKKSSRYQNNNSDTNSQKSSDSLRMRPHKAISQANVKASNTVEIERKELKELMDFFGSRQLHDGRQ